MGQLRQEGGIFFIINLNSRYMNLNIIYTFLVCVTFYFTIVRWVTQLKIFHLQLNGLPEALGLKQNRYWVILTWCMWFYQIYYWFTFFKLFQ